jgi:hypothetical protein
MQNVVMLSVVAPSFEPLVKRQQKLEWRMSLCAAHTKFINQDIKNQK